MARLDQEKHTQWAQEAQLVSQPIKLELCLVYLTSSSKNLKIDVEEHPNLVNLKCECNSWNFTARKCTIYLTWVLLTKLQVKQLSNFKFVKKREALSELMD